MAPQMRSTIVAQYPLPGGGKVALSVLAESMNGEQYLMLAKIIEAMVPLASSLGWKPGATEEPTKPTRPPRKPPAPPPIRPPLGGPSYPALSAVPQNGEQS